MQILMLTKYNINIRLITGHGSWNLFEVGLFWGCVVEYCALEIYVNSNVLIEFILSLN